ncbi:MAG: RluA family pseudouridine synthase [Candidatus Puniceispirillaceae bacterium]
MADYKIPESEQDSRLDRALKRRFGHMKQVQIEKSLRSGLMRVDGIKVKAGHRCQAGQIVTLPDWLVRPAQDEQTDEVRAISPHRKKSDSAYLDSLIIAQTKNWMALNKPAGLAVQGGTSTSRHIDGLLQSAYSHMQRPKLVHRLDKDTSGVLMIAKNDQTARRLSAAFQSHEIEKSYLALVLGQLPPLGDIKVPLSKSGAMGKEKMSPDFEDGQYAHTKFKNLSRSGGKMSLVALQPLTGRTHQLRVHMLAAKAPILGDGKYAGAQAHPGANFARQLHLHAQFLKLPDGQIIEAPLPAHMKMAISYLEMTSHIPEKLPDFDEVAE